MSNQNIEIGEGLLDAALAIGGAVNIDVIMIYTEAIVPISPGSFKLNAMNSKSLAIPDQPVAKGLEPSDTYWETPEEIVIDAQFGGLTYLANYMQLDFAFKKVQRLVVQTLAGLSYNMYIKSLDTQTTNTALGNLLVRIKMKQVRVVSQQTTEADKYKPRKDIDRSVNRSGSIVPQEMDEGSNLYRFFVKNAGT